MLARLPDASISSDALAADLKEIGSIGAGGVEFLPFYNVRPLAILPSLNPF